MEDQSDIDLPAALAAHALWINGEVGGARADLREADLTGANLTGADLPKGYRIAALCFGGWPITVTPEVTTIGCQRHPNELWLGAEADDPRIAEMHDDATAWWMRHRDAVCAVIRDVMATTTIGEQA